MTHHCSMPSDADESKWIHEFYQAHLDKYGYRANEWETITAYKKWLLPQIKPVTRERLSDEQLKSEGEIIFNTELFNTGDRKAAAMAANGWCCGVRACEKRLLGE